MLPMGFGRLHIGKRLHIIVGSSDRLPGPVQVRSCSGIKRAMQLMKIPLRSAGDGTGARETSTRGILCDGFRFLKLAYQTGFDGSPLLFFSTLVLWVPPSQALQGIFAGTLRSSFAKIPCLPRYRHYLRKRVLVGGCPHRAHTLLHSFFDFGLHCIRCGLDTRPGVSILSLAIQECAQHPRLAVWRSGGGDQ